MSRDWNEFWRGYSKCTGQLTWRVAMPADLPAIRRVRNISERFLKQPQRTVSLFASPVLLALVAENKDGKIVDLIYIEAQVEVHKMACTTAGFRESAGIQQDLAEWLRSRNFRRALVATPNQLTDEMADQLESSGFRCLNKLFSYWGIPL